MSPPNPAPQFCSQQVFLVLALVSGCLLGCDSSHSPRPPQNLILVTVDGLREDLVAQACERGDTPALAELRDRSKRYRQCRVSCPSRDASLASLFSGLPPEEHGVRLDGLFRLDEGIETLAETLAGRGVHNSAFLSDGALQPDTGLLQGFAEVDGPICPSLIMSLEGEDADFGSLVRELEETARFANDWLTTTARTPFCLWLQLRVSGYDHSGREPGTVYLERLAALDAVIADLLQNIRRAGRDRHTALILAGTVGELHGEHGRHDAARSLHDEALHVPLWILKPEQSGAHDDRAILLNEAHEALLGPRRSDDESASTPSASASRPPLLRLESLAASLEGGRPPVRGILQGDRIQWFDGRFFERTLDGTPTEITDAARAEELRQRLFGDPAPALAERRVTSTTLEQRLTSSNLLPDPASDDWRLHAGDVERLMKGPRGFTGPVPETLADWRRVYPDDARVIEMWLQSRIGRVEREDPSDEVSAAIATAVARLPHSPYLAALASHPRYHRVPSSEAVQFGAQALTLAPWYFPAARGIATGMGFNAGAAREAILRFAEQAPLGPEARQELEERFSRMGPARLRRPE